MRKLFSAAFIAMLATGVNAQNKLDYAARQVMESYHTPGMQLMGSGEKAESVSAIITLTGSSDINSFEKLGYSIFDVAGDIVIAEIPLCDVEALADMDFVKHISFGQKATPVMNLAREASLVDGIQAGTAEGLTTAYTGAGIVTSLFDTGLDPNNINFKDSDGQSRVKAIATVTGQSASMVSYTSSRLISSFTTDDADETHGTHVLGIMSGSYKGNANFPDDVTSAMPYYGVATGSDIVVTCGDLYNNCILKGVKYAVDYAKSAGQPAVINLSLGNTDGPHDGSDSFSKVLADYGKDAIICVAAGNDGDLPMGIVKKLTSADNTIKTFVEPYDIKNNSLLGTADNLSGQLNFYASDSKAFVFKVVVCNIFTGKIVDEIAVSSSTAGKKINIGGNSFADYEHLTSFDTATSSSSYVQVSSNVGTDNNRYEVNVTYRMTFRSGRYAVGFVVEGTDGQMINAYALTPSSSTTGIYGVFSSRSLSGWTAGTPDGSISSMACGENVIVVGSYNTRRSWTTLSGGSYSYNRTGYEVGHVSGFSSYGTLHNGETLPDFCAPGCAINSTYSSYYVRSAPSSVTAPYLTASVTNSSRTDYWGIMQGTSMATPLAAGVFALWLEADPTLTVDDIRDIAKSTAVKDEIVESENPVKWGAGKLDALAGLKEVLKRQSGIGSVMADDESALIVRDLGGRQFNVFVAGEQAISVSLVSMGGATAVSVDAPTNDVTLDASSVTPGVYVLAVNGANSRLTRKIVIR